MPKISAPSVPEHREAQRAALLAAAEAILLQDGVGGVNARSVTERAGLARSSFYDYFPSKSELLVAVATKAFELWREEIEAELARWAPGTERLRAYIATTLRMTRTASMTSPPHSSRPSSPPAVTRTSAPSTTRCSGR